jgi:hypothetical protein
MFRILTASMLTTCLGLVVATGWLLLRPTPAYAAVTTADCGNGYEVLCRDAKCVCRDLWGCVGYNDQGIAVSWTNCIGPRDGGGGGGGIGIVAE